MVRKDEGKDKETLSYEGQKQGTVITMIFFRLLGRMLAARRLRTSSCAVRDFFGAGSGFRVRRGGDQLRRELERFVVGRVFERHFMASRRKGGGTRPTGHQSLPGRLVDIFIGTTFAGPGSFCSRAELFDSSAFDQNQHARGKSSETSEIPGRIGAYSD